MSIFDQDNFLTTKYAKSHRTKHAALGLEMTNDLK